MACKQWSNNAISEVNEVILPLRAKEMDLIVVPGMWNRKFYPTLNQRST
jgi:hypothetical protein